MENVREISKSNAIEINDFEHKKMLLLCIKEQIM